MTERTVRFYEVVDEFRGRLADDLDFDGIRGVVSALPESEAYVHLDRMEVLGSTHEPGRNPAKPLTPLIALDRITRDVHLRIERRRNYRPLVLDEDETLAEPTFYALFPRNVLAVMRNSGAAPGPASFRDYINSIGVLDKDIDVVSLADRNALRALANVDHLTKFSLQVGPDVVAETFGNGFMRDTIRTLRRRLGAVEVEFTVKLRPGAMHDLSDQIHEEIQLAARDGALDLAEKASMTFRRLEDGRADTYDFIQEAVTQSVDVELVAATQQPTERSAAEQIMLAYNDLYDDIASALNSSEQ